MKRQKILIVEDDDDLRATLVAALTREGFSVAACGSGEAALAELRSDPKVDLVLLDMMLPDIGGWEVHRRMLEDERLSSIRTVAMSAGRVEMAAPVDILKKPIQLHTLIETVKRHLADGGKSPE
jgi:CheY-like chemotaxis protein